MVEYKKFLLTSCQKICKHSTVQKVGAATGKKLKEECPPYCTVSEIYENRGMCTSVLPRRECELIFIQLLNIILLK